MKREHLSLSLCALLFGIALYLPSAHWAKTPETAKPAALPLAGRIEQQGAQQSDPPVEQVQKNIQVLKGLPSSQLLTVMHFMRSSLGVRCDYCHVAENGKYWMDDKPAKQTARRMIQMVMDINREKFGGQTVITCNSCHQGRTRPAAVPSIEQGAFVNTTRDDTGAKPAPLPTVDQLLEKYLQALGGNPALEKVTTRVMKLSLLRPKLVNAGTPNAAILNRAETWPLEIYQKAPNKYLAVITTPDGVVYQGYNGNVGWIKTAKTEREMNAAELARIKRQADLFRDIKLKDQYLRMAVIGLEKIGNAEAYVVEAESLDHKTEKLFFDVQTGLLLRRTVFTQTLLGPDPEQTDFEDYRDVGGVKVPFKVSVSYLDDNHYGTTRKVIEIKQNVSLDDAKFDIPAAKP